MIENKTPDFDIKTTCCFTGHRILKKDFNEKVISNVINDVIKRGYKTFLVGMARGFDLKCVKALVEIKKNYNIDIVACLPCKDQNKYFTQKENEEYFEMLDSVDKKIYITETYNKECMILRNKYMVDNSSVLIAYYNYFKGGTHATVKYAEKQNKEIIFI